jgi:aminoglycoside phosphotransferase family enzyme
MQIHSARFLNKEFVFHVDENLKSSATRVVLNNSHPVMRGICLKMWLECHNDLYNTGDLTKQTKFLLEGLAFNRQFSRDIYYGIVPVLFDSHNKIKCGPLIAEPTLEKLAFDGPYALVMKRLEEEWQLDHQLLSGKLGNRLGMEFLANQVAEMHKKLDQSLPTFGTPDRISDKLDFNIERFHKALDGRKNNSQIMANPAFNKTDMTWIKSASMLLRQLSKVHQQDFNKRRREGHTKRCHGDLKATNLWICPSGNETQAQERLVALDCVDFNPEFCNIDTLSDVAMLAIDLEMRLEYTVGNRNGKLSGQQLTRHFLQTYLKASGENETLWHLLEYYMTEKAMVCAYMSMLYDGHPTLGEKYLKVVLAHSQEMTKYLPPHMSIRITKPLHLIAS